jgi:hypothetical protein
MKKQIGSIGFAPMIVYVLGFSMAGMSGAFAQGGATIIQYQQGVSPNGSYQHLGSEIRESTPTGNGGGGGLIRSGGDNKLRTVFDFDLTGITSDMIVTSISLQMHEDSVGTAGGTPVPVEVHQLTNTTRMIEGNGDFLGSFTDPFGVTWNRIQNNGTSDIPWATPGGDFSAAILSSATVTNNTPQFYTFGSSAAFIAAAQSAVANNKPLQLILYAPTTENFFGNFVRWDSDDAGNASFRPLLQIAYVPEPSIVALLGLSGLLLLKRRGK